MRTVQDGYHDVISFICDLHQIELLKGQNVIEFPRYAEFVCPAPKIPAVEAFPGTLQNRQGILEIPGATDFELLQNEVVRSNDPVKTTIHPSSSLLAENLSVMQVSGTQQVNGRPVKLKTKLSASKQGIPFQPCFVELEPRLDHAVAEAA
jgi:hypothetical protein